MDSSDDYRIDEGRSDEGRSDEGREFVRVALLRGLDDPADADRLLRDLDSALARTGARRVLFDYRGLGRDVDDLGEAMWSWASDRRLHAIAVLVDGEMPRVRTNMTALSRRVRLRAFLDEREATDWMRDPGRRTREIPAM